MAFNFSCILAIEPFGDPEPTVVGAEAYDVDFKRHDEIPNISSDLRFEEHCGYDSVIDCKLRCHDPRSDENSLEHTSDILVRLNRTTVVDENGKPSRMTAETVSEDTMDKAVGLFGLDREEFARCVEIAANQGNRFHIVKIPYAKHPPSVGLETWWISHGSHQAMIERVRQCFTQNGVLYALGCRSTAPTNHLENFNDLFETLRNEEPLHKFYCSSPPIMTSLGLHEKEERPKLKFLPAQIVFSEWIQYKTIMGLAAIEEEEEDAVRFESNQSTIRMVSVGNPQSHKLYGVLRHNPEKYRLGRGDVLKITLRTEIDSAAANDEGGAVQYSFSQARATVVSHNLSSQAGTVSLLLRREVNETTTDQWNVNVLPAVVAVGPRAENREKYAAVRRAREVHVRYCAHDDGKGIHIHRSLQALKEIEQRATLRWVKNALLGHRIREQEVIDMYACIEHDTQASKALKMAMARLNSRQAAALESTRALPSGVGIVEGPPGTGKTFLIANLVQPLVFSDRRKKSKGPPVLLLSTSNLSVDDIAVRVKALCDETGRQLGSTRKLNVVRLHSMDTERACFKNQLPTPHKINIMDERLRLNQYSLATLMLQMSGFQDMKSAHAQDERFCDLRDLCRDFARKDIDQERQEEKLDECIQKLRVAALEEADVVVATLAVAGDRELFGVIKPSAIIVDEASRATDPDIWPIFARYPKGAKLLLGDSQQLQPATSFNNSFRAQRTLSAMTRLRKLGYPVTLLVEQRRSVASIAKVYSDTFYKGSLITSTMVNAQLMELSRPFQFAMMKAYPESILAKQNAFLFRVDCGNDRSVQGSRSYLNVTNVKVVMDAIIRLVRQGISAARIALLVPYKSQLDLYDFAKGEVAREEASIEKLQLETFDSVQGREFDFVIVDFVRTSGLGFLKEDNRVNVALSRAQFGLIVVLNTHSALKRSSLSKVSSHFMSAEDPRPRVYFSGKEVKKLADISGLEDRASAKARAG